MPFRDGGAAPEPPRLQRALQLQIQCQHWWSEPAKHPVFSVVWKAAGGTHAVIQDPTTTETCTEPALHMIRPAASCSTALVGGSASKYSRLQRAVESDLQPPAARLWLGALPPNPRACSGLSNQTRNCSDAVVWGQLVGGVAPQAQRLQQAVEIPERRRS